MVSVAFGKLRRLAIRLAGLLMSFVTWLLSAVRVSYGLGGALTRLSRHGPIDAVNVDWWQTGLPMAVRVPQADIHEFRQIVLRPACAVDFLCVRPR